VSRRFALLAVASLGVAHAAIQEEIAALPERDGASVPWLRSWDDAKAPRAAAVLFTGGGGRVGLGARGIPRPGANFLVRTRNIFNRNGIATAVIDAPSGMTEMDDYYRMGKQHAADVGAIVAEMKRRFGGVPVFLVGTSRGTVSAAYAGAALGSAVEGVVLTSSMFHAARSGPGISAFDYSSVKSRLLFVHHVDDECNFTPYSAAQSAAGGRMLITVRGGRPAKSGPCEPFSPHGFFGVEGPTVRAIVAWMLGREAPKEVSP
jgi:pimeloyl-ACP methyl ester carboxylesterase